MKKLLVVLVTMFMCFSLVGCSSNEEETTQASVWSDQLKQEGKLIVGISPDYPPFENLTTDGVIEGFDAEVAKYIADKLGLELEFAQIEFDNIVTAVQTGQVDIGISAFTYDADRDVIFTKSYVESGQAVLVAKDSGIKTTADLKDKTIGGQTGTTGLDAAGEIEGTKEVTPFVDAMIGLASVGSTIDAFVSDYGVVKAYADANGLAVLDELLLSEEMSAIIKNGNDLLAEKVNEAITEFIASEKYEALRIEWGI